MAGFQEIPALNNAKDAHGRPIIRAYRITTANPNGGKTINIQLPKKQYTKGAALTCKAIVDDIETARALGFGIPERTKQLIDLYPDFKRRLAEKKLIPSKDVLTLAELWARYIQEQGAKENWAANTYRNKGVANKKFFEHFKRDQRADSVTKQQAQAFKDWLLTVSKSAQTVAGYIKDTKAAFHWALEAELIEKDPFQDVQKGSFENKKRLVYVPLSDFERILAACPSQLWRVIVLLWRRQGLRKDETKELTWEHFDFKGGLMTIPCPKNKRHAGKETRVMPIFPDVQRELETLQREQQTAGNAGAFLLPDSLRKIELYAPFRRILKKAGFKRWEKLIQNLRSSAAVDVEKEFGTITESEWIGHNPETARKHYLHTTPATIEAARLWGREKV